MPFTTLGFENTQSTMDSHLLECVGVAEDLWEHIKTLRPYLEKSFLKNFLVKKSLF